MAATLGALAERFDCRFRGNAERAVVRVAVLSTRDEKAISFLANPAYRAELAKTGAGIVILEERFAAECPTDCLITDNPYATFARIAAFLHPRPRRAPGIHASAVVAADASVSPTASVGPQAVIGGRAVVGDGVVIGAGAVIGEAASVGDDTELAARTVVGEHVRLGRRCIVHPGAIIGADGFGFAPDRGRWVKIPQLGGVVIGDDVEIGANTTIDRGTIEDTIIEDGVKLDNLVQIAHNVHVGEHTVMAAMSGAAGSTKIGRRCMIGGGVVLINHISVCDDVTLLFRSVVTKSIQEAGVYSGALAAEPAPQWRRNAVRFKQLDAVATRLDAIEAKLGLRSGRSKPEGARKKEDNE